MGLQGLAAEDRTRDVSTKLRSADGSGESRSFEMDVETMAPVTTLVVSGGVAANKFLRAV